MAPRVAAEKATQLLVPTRLLPLPLPEYPCSVHSGAGHWEDQHREQDAEVIPRIMG